MLNAYLDMAETALERIRNEAKAMRDRPASDRPECHLEVALASAVLLDDAVDHIIADLRSQAAARLRDMVDELRAAGLRV